MERLPLPARPMPRRAAFALRIMEVSLCKLDWLLIQFPSVLQQCDRAQAAVGAYADDSAAALRHGGKFLDGLTQDARAGGSERDCQGEHCRRWGSCGRAGSFRRYARHRLFSRT